MTTTATLNHYPNNQYLISNPEDDLFLRRLKQGIWLYFFLLIFEGALRKWFLPSLSAPLLIIRDPLVIALLFLAWKRGIFPNNVFWIWMIFISVISGITTLLVGHGNFFVAIYGARITLLHFPLLFVIGNIFTYKDVIKMGKITLLIAIPMTVLIAMQFYSPQSAWVNRGVGGDLSGSGFSGALGFFRPAATFSFTIGTSLFYSFVGCFVIFFWISRENINKALLIVATAAFLASIPLSISRYLFFQTVLTLAFAAFIFMKKPKVIGKFIIAGFGVFGLFLIFNNFGFFQTAIEVLTTRFENASESEGGLEGTLINRFLGGLLVALVDSTEMPLFGLGMGMGTQAGAKLLTGERGFIIAEGEWARIVGEMGPILGIGLIIGITIACFNDETDVQGEANLQSQE